jgi:hypothetical protein
VDVHDNLVYLSGSSIGLRVYDLTNHAVPRLVGYHHTPGDANGVAAKGNIAIIADGDNLGFYDCTQALSVSPMEPATPRALALLQNYPNPFNSSTQIQFELPTLSHVSLMVYDILGRNVTTLADREFSAGQYSLRWDGTDMHGQTVASGRYFVQLRTGEFEKSMTVTLLK